MAAEAAHRMEPVVVRAAAEVRNERGRSTTVINRKEIEGNGWATVGDALRHVPGLQVSGSSAGGFRSVHIRGADPNFALVLVDGIQVNDPTNTRGGAFDFSTLAADSVEKIEVLRGPASAAYGPNAAAGVIRIQTRRANRPLAAFEGAAGSHRRARASAAVGTANASADVLGGAAHFDEGDPSDGDDSLSIRGGHGNGGTRFGESAELRASAFAISHAAEAFPDDSGGRNFAVRRGTEKRAGDSTGAMLELSHAPDGPWSQSLTATYYGRDERIDSPGVAPGLRDPFGIPAGHSDTRFDRFEGAWRHRWAPHEAFEAGAGVSAWREEGASDDAYFFFGPTPTPGHFELTRDGAGAFADARWEFAPGLAASGAARIDGAEGFRPRVSPQAGLSYDWDEGRWNARAHWGEGFKLPSFFALGNSFVGNPALVSEESRTAEAAVTRRWGAASLTGVTFASRFEDLIDLDEGPPPRLVNRSHVRVEGGEVIASWETEELSLSAHVSVADSRIDGTDEPLRSRADAKGGALAQWRPAPAWSFALSAEFVGPVPDSSIPTGDRRLESRVRIDGSVAWRPRPGTRLFFRVENLTDSDWEEAVGFPAPGIRPEAGLRLEF